MKYYTFEIVAEKEAEDTGHLAHSPTLPGCYSNGKTIEEAKRTFAKPSSNISNPFLLMANLFHKTRSSFTLKN